MSVVDQWLTDDRSIGWERNSVRNSLDRWENRTHARVAIMGSSTSKDWLPGRYLQTLFGLKRGQVVDAHINGCHQGCTWSSVRRMRQRQRMKRCRWTGPDRCEPPKRKRFDAVFFGTNLFQMCEDGHSKRVLQHQSLLPTEDIGRLFAIYAAAKQPLEHMGRYLGMSLSGAYGDTRAIRDYWSTRLLGRGPASSAHRWYRKRAEPGQSEVLSCDYADDNVALKLTFTAALLDDLRDLSEMTYVMLLPDRSRALKDPVHQARWAAHISAHQKLVSTRPWVKLLDLTAPNQIKPHHFKDGFHLKRSAYKQQQNRLRDALAAQGALPSKKTEKTQTQGGDKK